MAATFTSGGTFQNLPARTSCTLPYAAGDRADRDPEREAGVSFPSLVAVTGPRLPAGARARADHAKRSSDAEPRPYRGSGVAGYDVERGSRYAPAATPAPFIKNPDARSAALRDSVVADVSTRRRRIVAARRTARETRQGISALWAKVVNPPDATRLCLRDVLTDSPATARRAPSFPQGTALSRAAHRIRHPPRRRPKRARTSPGRQARRRLESETRIRPLDPISWRTC